METDAVPKPTPSLEAVREKLAKIDAELLQCHQRADDLRLIASLKSNEDA